MSRISIVALLVSLGCQYEPSRLELRRSVEQFVVDFVEGCGLGNVSDTHFAAVIAPCSSDAVFQCRTDGAVVLRPDTADRGYPSSVPGFRQSHPYDLEFIFEGVSCK